MNCIIIISNMKTELSRWCVCMSSSIYVSFHRHHNLHLIQLFQVIQQHFTLYANICCLQKWNYVRRRAKQRRKKMKKFRLWKFTSYINSAQTKDVISIICIWKGLRWKKWFNVIFIKKIGEENNGQWYIQMAEFNLIKRNHK